MAVLSAEKLRCTAPMLVNRFVTNSEIVNLTFMMGTFMFSELSFFTPQ
jgi:hypothetical protein